MPIKIGPSRQTFNANVSTEVKAKEAQGYSPAKSAQIGAAIAYKQQRKAKRKAK